MEHAAPEVVTYRSTRRASIAFALSVTLTAGLGTAALVLPVFGWPALAASLVTVACAIRLIAAGRYPKAFLEIDREGVRVYPPDGRHARLIRWEILHGLLAENGGGRGKTRSLRFMLMDVPWVVPVPVGTPDPEVLGARILALRPHAIPLAKAEDAEASLDAAFGFRIPKKSRLLFWEKHRDGTARWDLDMPESVLRELRSATLRCSPWYPLPPAMKFELGGHTGRFDLPARAHYALGEGRAEHTPVLIRDDTGRRLICLLTRSMG